MKQLPRLSVCVFFAAALSLPPAASGIGLTIGDSSLVKSEIVVNFTTYSDENLATDASFPRKTLVEASGGSAEANWSFENNPTSAVFSADTVKASTITALATSENAADLAFTLTEGVNYSITGALSATGQLGQAISVSVYFKGPDGTIVDIDQTVPYFLGTTINFDEIPASASDETEGFLPAGDYTLEFSLGVISTAVVGSNSISGSFSIVLGDQSGSSEPLIGGTPVEGLEGWFLSEWFGYYSTEFAPWLFHAEHGFIYRFPESSNASTYFFDSAMGAWWWTNTSVYPSLFVFDPPADRGGTDIGFEWLWYFEGSSGPRWFSVLTGAHADSILSFHP